MAMGRGLTLQCGDDAINLTRSWNKREPRLGGGTPKPGLSRKPDASFHHKKHGGHFQLAVNFQSRSSPTTQLITPASLMSSAVKEKVQDKDDFQDAYSEEDDTSDDEVSLSEDEDESEEEEEQEDEDDDDDDDDNDDIIDTHAQNSLAYNYNQALEEDEGLSSCDDDAPVETKGSDEELEDAIEFIQQEKLEIERRQFGFISLEDSTNQNRGKKDGEQRTEKLIKPRLNASSDKENVDIQNINSLKPSQRTLQRSAYQNGMASEEKPKSSVEKDKPRQPLKTSEKQNVTESTVRKGFPIKQSVDEPVATDIQRILDQNSGKDVRESKKDKFTGEQVMSQTSPVNHNTDGERVTSKKTSLSPHAAPFVPLSSSVKGRVGTVDIATKDRNGLETKPTSWSSEYDSQQVNSPQVPEPRRLVPKIKELPVPPSPVPGPSRSQTTSHLSDKELENEYGWRKYKLIRKVKQILKPQTLDDGKSSLHDDCVSQLCNAMSEASSSFGIFTTYPKELAIVLEEVIRQSVEETVQDDDYQKDFIELFHKLSAFTPDFDQDFKTAIKLIEKHFLKPFIGAHLEKLGLRYCQFLGRLYGSFCQSNAPTKEMLEDIIMALCKKWIIFNEKGTNLNAEITEMTFAKCLQTITKEMGPFCPRDKWKDLMGDVKGQIFSKRAQNVKEVFLEILLYSEGIGSSSCSSQSVTSQSVAKDLSKGPYPSSEDVVSSPSQVKCASSEPPVTAEGGHKERDSSDKRPCPEGTSESQLTESNSSGGDPQKSAVHSIQGAHTFRESQSGSESTKRGSSPYRSPYNDSTKATYLSTKLKASSVSKKEKDLKNMPPILPVRKRIQQGEHSVSCNGESGGPATNRSLAKKGEPCDWWDYDAACQQQKAAEVIQEEMKRQEEEAETEDGNVMDEHQADATREAEINDRLSDQGLGDEVWDDELIPNPPPLIYPSATKRFISGNSLRFQREQYELTIPHAAKTYEVYVGDSVKSSLDGVAALGDRTTGIQQADDDVVILENSDSDDDDDSDDDGNADEEEVPMIWGDDLAGVSKKQALTQHNPMISATGTRGPMSNPPHIFGQNIDINRTLGSSPWNARPLVVFQEEEDTESSLSKIEIIAQRTLEEKRPLGAPSPWENMNLAAEGEVD